MRRHIIGIVLLMLTIGTVAQQTTDSIAVDTAINEQIDEPEALPKDTVINHTAKDAINAAVEAAEKLINESKNSSIRSIGRLDRRETTKFDPYDTLTMSSPGYEGLAGLDSIVGDFNVFLIGENHLYSKSNAKIWLKTIKYLHEYAGVRNIIFEYGASYGFLVNEYLQTKDSALFSSIVRFVYPAYSEAIKELAEYNSELPDSAKLYFAGIDIDRGVYPILKSLDYLLPEDIGMLPDSVLLHVQSIKSLAEYNKTKLLGIEEGERSYYGFNYKTAGSLDLIQSSFLNNEVLFQELLQDNFAQFKKIIVDQYDERKEWLSYRDLETVQEYIYRETQMYRRFQREYASRSGGWFGQFGRCHAIKKEVVNNSCEWYLFNSLADRIHTSNESGLKLMTIGQVYLNDDLFGTLHEEDTDLFDSYIKAMDYNSVAFFDLRSDKAILRAFGDEFDYIIFNKYTTLNTGIYDKRKDTKRDEEDKMYISANLGFGSQEIDIDGINGLFSDSLTSVEFQSNIPVFIVHFNLSKGRFFSSLVYGVYADQERKEYGKSYMLSGYFVKSTYGFDLVKGAMYSVVPALGFSANSLNFEIREEEPISLPNAGIGNLRTTLFTNPSLAFDFELLAQVNLNRFTFGSNIGYVLDISKKDWRTNGEQITDSPNTSFTGVRWSTWVGWSF